MHVHTGGLGDACTHRGLHISTSSKIFTLFAAANAFAIFLEVTTAEIGCPLPIGFPRVTMSGHTPESKEGCG